MRNGDGTPGRDHAAPAGPDGGGPAAGPEPDGGASQERPFGALPPPWPVALAAAIVSDRRLPRRVRSALRKPARLVLPRRPVDVTVEGLRLRLRGGGNKVDDDLLLKRRLDEPVELGWVREALRPGDLFVDIGANIGIATLDALLRGPAGVRAIAFEPHPGLFPRLLFHLSANGVADRAFALRVAVGPASGTARLHANSGRNAGRSSLDPFEGDREVGFDVTVRPLLDVLVERGVPGVGVLKIDVEGFEDRALLPFLDDAPDRLLPRAVVIETTHAGAWQKDCLTALGEMGYFVRGSTAENLMLQRGGHPC